MTTFNIYIAKAEKSLPVDFDSLPPHIQNRIIEHGLTQKLNDAHAGEKDVNLALELAQNVLDNIQAGDWAKRAVSNPIQSELRLLLVAVCKKLGSKPEDLKGQSVEDLAGIIAGKKGTNPERVLSHFQPAAEAHAKAKAEEAVKRAEAAKSLSAGLENLI